MVARPRFRQLGLGELLDESFRLFRSNFVTFVAIAALVLVPYQLISFALQLPFQNRIFSLTTQLNAGGVNPQSPFSVLGELAFWYLGLLGVGLLYGVVFQPLLQGALTHVVAERYVGNEASVGSSFGAALRRAPALIGSRLLPTLVALLGFGLIGGGFAAGIAVLFSRAFADPDAASGAANSAIALSFLGVGLIFALTIVALLLYTRIFFTPQAVMIENQGAWASLKRSWSLTRGYFWRTVGYLLVITILVWVLVAIPSAIFTVPLTVLGVDRQVQLLVTTVVNTVFSVLATPFSLICYTLMYFDVRIRKEGFDIEQHTSAMLGAEPATPYAPGNQW